jgi:hypothetical protein
MGDSHIAFSKNNFYLLWNRKESYVLVQTYTLGDPAVKGSDLKCILAGSVMRIEQCTCNKLEGGCCANRDST